MRIPCLLSSFPVLFLGKKQVHMRSGTGTGTCGQEELFARSEYMDISAFRTEIYRQVDKKQFR